MERGRMTKELNKIAGEEYRANGLSHYINCLTKQTIN